MSDDFVDEMIARRTARDPSFPQRLEEARTKRGASYYERWRAERLADLELAAEYERPSPRLGPDRSYAVGVEPPQMCVPRCSAAGDARSGPAGRPSLVLP